eukprot:TRINITY_DN12999_c0_g1_i1.p1 TRINITY_DN12999_c0_g1~~TRINITY_DN12999_c0_g1_i1.p1  ORF type:complete len:794 (+),score=154.18 TRINITY_DN12999_c0_g1_i1:654-3035(+)
MAGSAAPGTPPHCIIITGAVVDSIEALHGEEEYILLPRGFPFTTASIPDALAYNTTNLSGDHASKASEASSHAPSPSTADKMLDGEPASLQKPPAQSPGAWAPTPRRARHYPTSLSPKSAVFGPPSLADSEGRLGASFDVTVSVTSPARGTPRPPGTPRRGLFTITQKPAADAAPPEKPPSEPSEEGRRNWAEQWDALFSTAASPHTPRHDGAAAASPLAAILPQQLTPVAPSDPPEGRTPDGVRHGGHHLRTVPAKAVMYEDWVPGAMVTLGGAYERPPTRPSSHTSTPYLQMASRPSSVMSAVRTATPLVGELRQGASLTARTSSPGPGSRSGSPEVPQVPEFWVRGGDDDASSAEYGRLGHSAYLRHGSHLTSVSSEHARPARPELWMVQRTFLHGLLHAPDTEPRLHLHVRRVLWGDQCPGRLRADAAVLTDECAEVPISNASPIRLVLEAPPCLWWTDGRQVQSLGAHFRADACAACGNGVDGGHGPRASLDPYGAEVELVMRSMSTHSAVSSHSGTESSPAVGGTPSGRHIRESPSRFTPDIMVTGSRWHRPSDGCSVESTSASPVPGEDGVKRASSSSQDGARLNQRLSTPDIRRQSVSSEAVSRRTSVADIDAADTPSCPPTPLKSALKRPSSARSARLVGECRGVPSPAAPHKRYLSDTLEPSGPRKLGRSFAQDSLATVGRYLVPLRKCVDSWMSDTDNDMTGASKQEQAKVKARRVSALALALNDDMMDSSSDEEVKVKRVVWSDAPHDVMYFEKVEETYDPQDVSDDESESEEEDEEHDDQ